MSSIGGSVEGQQQQQNSENENTSVTNVGGVAGGGGSGKGSQLSLTPRFTPEEKEVLYSLFHQHEDVIDIKYRKKQRSKYSVRDAWEEIVREFNEHPGVTASRNLKQIQKFWLNARLRKQYPFRAQSLKNGNNNGGQQQQMSDAIKDEPEFQINANESPEHNDAVEEFEDIDMEQPGVTQIENDPLEQHHQQPPQQQMQQHQQQATTIQTQHISVDQISAEKLTLNDLLHFKTARPGREEIILQIKHPSDATGAQITIPSPTRITIPSHSAQQHAMATITANGYNQQIISEIKPQQITLAQYQAQQQQQQLQQQQQQQQLAQQQLVAAHQQQAVKMQLHPASTTAQFTTSAPFTCTTYNAMPASLPTSVATVATAIPATPTAATVAVETFEEKINYFKLKEVELRFKEEQVALEKKKIELNRAQEEMKHMKEIHRLQVEELKLKIRILQEEEKQMRKQHSQTSLNS